VAKTEKSGFDQLPKELHEMKIKDDKSKKNNNEKVFIGVHFFYVSHKHDLEREWG